MGFLKNPKAIHMPDNAHPIYRRYNTVSLQAPRLMRIDQVSIPPHVPVRPPDPIADAYRLSLPVRLQFNVLHQTIHLLRDEVAREAEEKEERREAPEPRQVVLAGHLFRLSVAEASSLEMKRKGNTYGGVHAPHSRDDVHGQHDRSQDREFAQNIRCLLRALVHFDVDLREVVRVSAREDAVSR